LGDADSAGRYHGPVWGVLPLGYPTAVAERTYKSLVDRTEDHPRVRELMGAGFRGAALRWRTATESHASYSELVASHGIAPASGPSYEQDRSLFVFFTSGLASLESFAFALHALGAYRASEFALDDDSLRNVKPSSVARRYIGRWPDLEVSGALDKLAKSDEFGRWNRIRNVVSHRAPPPKLIRISNRPGSGLGGVWQVEKLGTSKADEPLQGLTDGWASWLDTSLADVWRALESSIAHWDGPASN
jgi:hypothetical protein